MKHLKKFGEPINEELKKKATEEKEVDAEKKSSTDRKEDIKEIFGKYGDDVPEDVIKYLVKSPFNIIGRYIKTYGLDDVLRQVLRNSTKKEFAEAVSKLKIDDKKFSKDLKKKL